MNNQSGTNISKQFMLLIGLFSWILIGFSFVVLEVSASTKDNTTQEALAETINELKAKAATTPVRVIVRLGVDEFDGDLFVCNAKARLTEIMKKAGVTQIEAIEGQPMMVMELTADQLDHLLASGFVEFVQEDKIEGLY